jgi:hypothetical protein
LQTLLSPHQVAAMLDIFVFDLDPVLAPGAAPEELDCDGLPRKRK